MGRVPDQPYGLVAALGEEALQQECDLAVPARDHYAHAASLLTGIIGRGDDVASGPCCDRQGPHGPPKAWHRQSRLQAPSLRHERASLDSANPLRQTESMRSRADGMW